MPEPIIVAVSEKGQITIPQEIRRHLAAKKGSKLVLVLKGEKLLIRKVPDMPQSTEDDFEDMMRYSELSLTKLWDNREDEVWNEYLKT